jgi:hypothetical protein
LQGSFAGGDPDQVGVLHSLSGTMAISETTLKGHDGDVNSP